MDSNKYSNKLRPTKICSRHGIFHSSRPLLTSGSGNEFEPELVMMKPK